MALAARARVHAPACARTRVQRRAVTQGRTQKCVKSPLGLSVSRRKQRDAVVTQSFFGVGAPEALVIGVVALLVFGPKGLADIAKQLGATIREFQPTIRELQDASREFQDTLRDEIEKPLEEVKQSVVAPPPPRKREAPVGEGLSEGAKREASASVSFSEDANSSDSFKSENGSFSSSEDYIDNDMKARAAAEAWGASAEQEASEEAARAAEEKEEQEVLALEAEADNQLEEGMK